MDEKARYTAITPLSEYLAMHPEAKAKVIEFFTGLKS